MSSRHDLTPVSESVEEENNVTGTILVVLYLIFPLVQPHIVLDEEQRFIVV
jgi:hypothetical protein